MPDVKTIIPQTEASRAKLRVLATLTASFGVTEDQALAFAEALIDFTEQAILDDRARQEENRA